MTRRALSLLVLLLLALPGRAADAPGAPGAVLRIGGGRASANCTAVLVAPDAALTAAHCTKSGHAAFFAGWEAGRAEARRNGSVTRRPRLEPRAANLHHLDQARLTLARPFPGLVPVRTGPPPETGSEVRIVSYPRRAASAETATCRVLGRPGTEILLDCPARSGMSGAPIFQNGRLVGLLTNRIGRDRSLGTVLAPDLLETTP